MSLLTVNYKLLLWYVYDAGDALDSSKTSLVRLLYKETNTLSRGQAVCLLTSDPCPLPQKGAGLICQSVAQLIPPPVMNSEHWGLQQVCLDVSLRTCNTKYWTKTLRACEMLAEKRASTVEAARTVRPAVGRSRPPPICLYYIVLTKSLCLTTLVLYSNGETLLVYVFDICTNAPLWNRKWNLDISGINWYIVSLFKYHHTGIYTYTQTSCQSKMLHVGCTST